MSEAEIADLCGAVLQLLREAPGQRLIGAVLGKRLRSLTGRTVKDHGFASLADFVRQHLHGDVSVVAGSADSVFELQSRADAQGAGTSPGHFNVDQSSYPARVTDLRKVWKSPRSPLTLRVRLRDGAVSAITRGSPVGEDEVDLVPPSAEDHKAIGRRFLETHVPEERRAPFVQHIEAAEGAWWLAWDPLFRDMGPSARVDWLRFRDVELFALLDAALRSAGLTEEVARSAREAIDRTRMEARKNIVAQSPARVGSALRQALLMTLEQMSEEDLRRIWVPAGLLHDALQRNR
jgi:hypothetical protein